MKGKWAIALCLVLSLTLTPTALAQGGHVIRLTPTGVDDTENIRDAFIEAVAHPGSVIEFDAGDFYLSDTVEVYNFSGMIRGQGSERTIIRLKPGVLLHTAPDPFWSSVLGISFPVPYLFVFRYQESAPAELHMMGLGFDLVGKAEWWPWVQEAGAEFFFPLEVTGLDLQHPSQLNTTWRDLHIKGHVSDDYLYGRNIGDGIALMNLAGTHVVSGCRFENLLGNAVNAWWLNGGGIQIGGPRPEDRVVVHDTGGPVFYAQSFHQAQVDVSNLEAHDIGTVPEWNVGSDVLYAAGLNGCRVHMSGVETFNSSGAFVSPWGFSGPAEQPSTFLFEHNTIRQAPGTTWAGFEMWQDWDVKSNIIIRNNRISGEGSWIFGPIFTLGAQNAIITNNQITGSGPAAIYRWVDDSGGMVKGNNVQGWTVDSGPCESEGCLGLPLAPIWLAWNTSGITVVGSGNLRTNVFDESDNPDTPAYDGANNLVGVNSQGAHIGQAIRDAMQARIAAKKLFMRPY